MKVERLSVVLPVDDLPAAARAWSALLGVEPTLVDDDRWAQFDIAGSRLALAGTDRATDVAAVMLKVENLAAARDEALARGLEAGQPERGPHEVRCVVQGAGGAPVVLYAPATP